MNINLTLIGQSITFLVFVWFCKAYVWTAIRNAMEEREKKIAQGLEAADRAEQDLELTQQKVADQLRESKKEAQSIIENANKRAALIVEEAKNDARVEGERLKEAARAEIEQEVNRAKEQLRSQIAALALSGAEKVLESSIDESAHRQMLDKLAADL